MTKEETKKYWQDREVGAAWVGEKSMKIKMKDRDGNTIEFVGFPNRFKNESKHPDWNLFISDPKPEDNKPPAAKETKSKTKTTPKIAAPEPEPEPNMDDVPF